MIDVKRERTDSIPRHASPPPTGREYCQITTEIYSVMHFHHCVEFLCPGTDASTAQAVSAGPISDPKGTGNPAPLEHRMSRPVVSRHIFDASFDIGDILVSHISACCHVSGVVQRTCS